MCRCITVFLCADMAGVHMAVALALQVQELMTKAEAPVQSADSHQSKQSQGAAAESEKLTHLTDVNRQLEDHVTSLDSQLEQLQQELEAAGTEATAASASAQEALENALSAQRAQHETSLVQSKATVELVQEDCNAKALQVGCNSLKDCCYAI